MDVIRNGERINALSKNAISTNQREMSLERHITDRRLTVSLSIDDLRVGDIIDYQATIVVISGSHPLCGKYYHEVFRLNWDCKVYEQTVRITNHSSRDIIAQYCLIEAGEYRMESTAVTEGETFFERYSDLDSLAIEDASPNWLWPNTLLVTTDTEWPELSSYLYGFYDSLGVLSSNINIAELPDIDLCDDVSDNIISIVRFVQNEIRYKGENYGVFTHTPKKPELTLEKRYGDCKDKSNLLVALLRSINVCSHLALVNTNYGSKLLYLNPSPYHFNHMVVHVRHDGIDYYFDPTIKKQSGDLEHSATLDYGYVLILSREGNNLEKIPHSISQDVFRLKHVIDFTEPGEGIGTLTIQRKYYSHRANNARYYLQSSDREKLAKDYLHAAIEETDLELVSIKPLSIERDDAALNVVETEEKYGIVKLLSSNSDNQIHLPTRICEEFPTTRSRGLPVNIELDGRVTHLIEVHYRSIPYISSQETVIENKWFTYHDSIRVEGNSVFLYATSSPLKKSVNSKHLDEYSADVEKLQNRSMNNIAVISHSHEQTSRLGERMLAFAATLIVILLVLKGLV